jgi:hypothetical protein
MFQHEFIQLPTIVNEDTANGRFYVTPNGDRYESVTTFLGKFSDTKWLDEWKERVGEEEVAKRSTQAKNRGTAVHGILEQIVLNNPQYARRQMPNNLIMAESIANKLRACTRIIKGVEIGLWSDKLRIAGRADLFATWNDIDSIIDFKTSKWPKKEEDIKSYFLQCTIYAMMVEELLGIAVPQIVVMIGVDFNDAQVFVKDKAQFVPEILSMAESPIRLG